MKIFGHKYKVKQLFCLFLYYTFAYYLPDSYSRFGIVIGESFVLSKPVISTNVTGPIEILGDSKYGIIVEEDVQQLADAMEKMIIDDQIRSHYAIMGHQRLEYFSSDKIMEKIYHICQK